MAKQTVRQYKAGVIDGHKHVWWSSHKSHDLAVRAARKYKRGLTHATGGAGSWDGYVQWPDGHIEAI